MQYSLNEYLAVKCSDSYALVYFLGTELEFIHIKVCLKGFMEP